MSELILVSSQEPVRRFDLTPNQPIHKELVKNYIPPAAVLIEKEGEQVSSLRSVERKTTYRAILVEGYDIEPILKLYDGMAPENAIFSNRRVSFDNTSGLKKKVQHFDSASLVEHVEETVYETLEFCNLPDGTDDILVALSGGNDSASMLLALSDIEPSLDVEVSTATVQDPAGFESNSYDYAESLSDELNHSHTTIGLQEIQSVYELDIPPEDAFDVLSEVYDRTEILTARTVIHQRMLEYVAEQNDITHICLGEHMTEIVAGVINAVTVGTDGYLNTVPKRSIGSINYIYPVAFLDKTELSLYHKIRRTYDVPSSVEDERVQESMTMEQAFMYYFADFLKSLWPGISHWLIESQLSEQSQIVTDDTEVCHNCEKIIRYDSQERLCFACRIFDESGLL